MDPAKAKFEFDAGRRLLRITAAGFWDLSDVEQFRLAQIEQIRSIASSGTRPKKLRLMIDIRQKTAQLAEVVNALQVLFGSLSTEVARTAVIVGGALVARQATRIGANAHHQVFYDEREATAWLLADD